MCPRGLVIRTSFVDYKSKTPLKKLPSAILSSLIASAGNKVNANYSARFKPALQKEMRRRATRRQTSGIEAIFADVLPYSQNTIYSPPVTDEEIPPLAAEHNADIVVLIEEIRLNARYSTSRITNDEDEVEFECDSLCDAAVYLTIRNAKTGAVIDSHTLFTQHAYQSTIDDDDDCYKEQSSRALYAISNAAKDFVPLFIPHLSDIANDIFLLVHGVTRDECLEAKQLAENGNWEQAKAHWEKLREKSFLQETKMLMDSNIAIANKSLYPNE